MHTPVSYSTYISLRPWYDKWGVAGASPPPRLGFIFLYRAFDSPIARFLDAPMHAKYEIHPPPPPGPMHWGSIDSCTCLRTSISRFLAMPMHTRQLPHLYWSTIVGRFKKTGCMGWAPPPPLGFDRYLYNCLRTSIARLDMPMRTCMSLSYVYELQLHHLYWSTIVGRQIRDAWGEPPPPPPPIGFRFVYMHSNSISRFLAMSMHTYQLHHVYWSTIVGQQIRGVWSDQAPPPRFVHMHSHIHVSYST